MRALHLDVDLPVLARHAVRFREANIVLVASTEEVAHVCNDKWETYRFLRNGGFNPPLTFLQMEEAEHGLQRGELRFPLIVKPRWGMGSIGVYGVDDASELPVLFRKVFKDIERSCLQYESTATCSQVVLIQQALSGQEYGLDVVNDLQGRYVTTFVKKKLAMRAGETDSAVTVADATLAELGKALGGALRHRGNLDVDVFLDEGGPHVLELNARFGGGYPFSHLAGANLPKAVVSWIRGEAADPSCFAVKAGVKGVKVILPVVHGQFGANT